MMLIQLLLACQCRPATPPVPSETPPTETSDTADPTPVETGSTGDTAPPTCPVLEDSRCFGAAFMLIEGRVEVRQVLPGFSRPVCVADDSALAGCERLLDSSCPPSAGALLLWGEEQNATGRGVSCQEADSAFFRDPPLQLIHCNIPAEIDDPPDQLHGLDFYYDTAGLVAVYDRSTAALSSYARDFCCSEGGSVERALWSDELFFECGW